MLLYAVVLPYSTHPSCIQSVSYSNIGCLKVFADTVKSACVQLSLHAGLCCNACVDNA